MLNTELSHIISPMSAPWSGWTLLVLFLCAVLGEFMQPGIITQATTSLWAKTDRTYKSAPPNTVGQLLISVFRFGTLSMAICMSLYTGGSFSFVAFSAVCGLVFAVLIIKMLCNRLLDYTFMLSRRFMPIYEQFANIATIASCILYPGLLVLLRIGRPEYSIWVLGIITILFLVMIIYRLVRTYIQSLAAFVYVALYVATLEILPLAALYYISAKTISIL